MGQDVEYCNDKGTKARENSNQVHYEACGQKQKYTKNDHCKQSEEQHHTKYFAGCAPRQAVSCISSRSDRPRCDLGSSRSEPQRSLKARGSTQLEHRRSASKACDRKSSKSKSSHGSENSIFECPPEPCSPKPCIPKQCAPKQCSPKCSPKKPEMSLAQRLAHCYEIRQVRKLEECNRKPCWQHGKYVRDECGSGIVTKKYLLGVNRRMWCKTPLSMYQATIGELARKILCREISVPRDIKDEPPSNIAEYIMPPCRGYYRKYDCLRPCEEDFAVIKNGKKYYRDRVERHWEPCFSKGQKHKLDINEYAPHNAYLALKLRRQNISDDQLCW